MASDEKPANPEQSAASARQPLTPAKRKRLQKIFERGSQMMSHENHDYANELLSQCVMGDPANMSYAQSFLGNLQKKYNNNKTGGKLAQLKERGARGAIKKALTKNETKEALTPSEWDEVIRNCMKVLAVNPWDVPALMAMATACDGLDADETELYFLNAALNVDSKNPETNRRCAMAMAARREFKQAIHCWHRVQQALPDDAEAKREISRLAVEQTIKAGRYEDEDGSSSVSISAVRNVPQGGVSKGAIHRESAPRSDEDITPEDTLRQRIDQDPNELSNFFELAQLYLNKEEFDEAEKLLNKALEVSGGDPAVKSRLDDAQIRRLGKAIITAEDDETKEKFRQQYLEKQLEYRKGQCERYPTNLRCKFDLGAAYESTKQYTEAIREFQQAKNDSQQRGRCLLHLGRCFQQIKQYRLAISHYESAIREIPERELDDKKKALYLVGKLAFGLKDLDKAEEHLTHLAEIDFAHKDVSSLLDKIREIRENE